jgi:hypothetical protein
MRWMWLVVGLVGCPADEGKGTDDTGVSDAVAGTWEGSCEGSPVYTFTSTTYTSPYTVDFGMVLSLEESGGQITGTMDLTQYYTTGDDPYESGWTLQGSVDGAQVTLELVAPTTTTTTDYFSTGGVELNLTRTGDTMTGELNTFAEYGGFNVPCDFTRQ